MGSFEHRQTASLALENAHDIAADVNFLMEAKRWPRSLALAVIGCEEAGKALPHIFAALELGPAVVAVFDTGRSSSPLSNHAFKQLTVDRLGAETRSWTAMKWLQRVKLPATLARKDGTNRLWLRPHAERDVHRGKMSSGR